MIGCIICFIGAVGITILSARSNDHNTSSFLAGLSAGCLIAIGILILVLTKHPTPIDVYRGNTSLEVIYKDSIPIDSVVVFKEK